ncbi:AIPR family protein [Pantoea ananatis]|uniref:AIPR family protein n=1 Tax=Pantoea ananas TaxID=553 RepID=UPI001B30E626|nr:AIPR family protein [Pantoea ananatis]
MQHIKNLLKKNDLIDKYGIGNAHLLWSMGLYLDESDFDKLASDGLTDGGNDKKIDFVIVSNGTLFIVQGYYTTKEDIKIVAPANKASDLNTALAWIMSGQGSSPNEKLRSKIQEIRKLIDDGEIEAVELLYIHNCAESEQIRTELETCKNYLEGRFNGKEIEVSYKELGVSSLEKLYIALSQQIVVTENVKFNGDLIDSIQGDGWTSHVGFANGAWLNELFRTHGEELFSANYRGFMGLSKRRKINSAIRNTAETTPKDFFVFNNGVSILTTKFNSDDCTLEGISIINGAQTTGSIGSVQDNKKLDGLKVLCKVIECTDSEKVKKIVQYNNTQNHITTWDHYSNSTEQKQVEVEFSTLGYVYSLKRGFENTGALFGIESVAQPLVALHGDYASANRGKNYVFDTKTAYDNAFHESKAQHILLAYTISKAIEKVKSNLKSKENKIASDESNLLFLQNLKSRFFLISVIGEILDELTDKPLNKKLVKYSYNSALAKNYSLEDLIELWVPVIAAILPYVIHHSGQDLTSFLSRTENPLQLVSEEVKNIINSLKAFQPIPALLVLSQHVQ